MYKQGINDFKYFVGISSLAQIATRDDRVCVLNILGGESSDVTPVSHAYSGGNVVFGTAPGKGGQTLATPHGDIPVYNNVREGMQAGHRFNCGVVYLPPSAARDGVARESIMVNPSPPILEIHGDDVTVEATYLAARLGLPVATTRPTRCAKDRSRSCRIPAASARRSRSTCE